MDRKPLPSEIEEQKDKMTILKIHNPIGYPGLKIIIPDNTVCKKCGKVKSKIPFPFIKGWDCECK